MSGEKKMEAAHSDMKLTYEDFLLFPDDGKRHELIDGEHYVTPSPNTKHQAVSGNLYFVLRQWLERNPVGKEAAYVERLVDRPKLQRHDGRPIA